MARTKIAAPVSTGTKSDRFRSILRANAGGPGIAVDPNGPGGVARAADAAEMGYAFAYGVAGRTDDPDFPGKSYATTRAERRGTKSVRVSDGTVIVRIVGPDGAVSFVSVDTATGKTKTVRR